MTKQEYSELYVDMDMIMNDLDLKFKLEWVDEGDDYFFEPEINERLKKDHGDLFWTITTHCIRIGGYKMKDSALSDRD